MLDEDRGGSGGQFDVLLQEVRKLSATGKALREEVRHLIVLAYCLSAMVFGILVATL